jgi:hypothetical protein
VIALVPVASATSSAILETLLAEAGNDRRRETLNRLKAACDALEVRRQSYKLTDIQRVLEDTHGKEAGPKAQSISNERKRQLGMYHYVEARLREMEVKPSTRTARLGPMETRIATAIDRIDDMDTRSAMVDLQDRLMVAEKGLERAKKLFKTLRPGVDTERLMNGQGLLDTTNSAVSPEHIAALQQVVAILTDDEKLSTVGLSFDGRRVRRRGGTRDELLSPSVLSGLQELVAQLSVQA